MFFSVCDAIHALLDIVVLAVTVAANDGNQ
jgi:hypothetical protein